MYQIYQFFKYLLKNSEAWAEPCQTSELEYLVKIVNKWKLRTIFEKFSILDMWPGSEYAFTVDSLYLDYVSNSE